MNGEDNTGRKARKSISMILTADAVRITNFSMEGSRLLLTLEATLAENNLSVMGPVSQASVNAAYPHVEGKEGRQARSDTEFVVRHQTAGAAASEPPALGEPIDEAEVMVDDAGEEAAAPAMPPPVPHLTPGNVAAGGVGQPVAPPPAARPPQPPSFGVEPPSPPSIPMNAPTPSARVTAHESAFGGKETDTETVSLSDALFASPPLAGGSGGPQPPLQAPKAGEPVQSAAGISREIKLENGDDAVDFTSFATSKNKPPTAAAGELRLSDDLSMEQWGGVAPAGGKEPSGEPQPVMETWDPSTLALGEKKKFETPALSEESSIIGGERHGEPQPAFAFGLDSAPPAAPMPPPALRKEEPRSIPGSAPGIQGFSSAAPVASPSASPKPPSGTGIGFDTPGISLEPSPAPGAGFDTPGISLGAPAKSPGISLEPPAGSDMGFSSAPGISLGAPAKSPGISLEPPAGSDMGFSSAPGISLGAPAKSPGISLEPPAGSDMGFSSAPGISLGAPAKSPGISLEPPAGSDMGFSSAPGISLGAPAKSPGISLEPPAGSDMGFSSAPGISLGAPAKSPGISLEPPAGSDMGFSSAPGISLGAPAKSPGISLEPPAGSDMGFSGAPGISLDAPAKSPGISLEPPAGSGMGFGAPGLSLDAASGPAPAAAPASGGASLRFESPATGSEHESPQSRDIGGLTPPPASRPAAVDQEAPTLPNLSLLQDANAPKSPSAPDKPEAGGTTVLIRYTCPKCKTQGMQAVDKVGTVVNCSNCGKAMRLVMKK